MGTLFGATDCMDTLEGTGRSFGRPSKDDKLSFLTFLLVGATDDEWSSTIGLICVGDGGDCRNGSVVVNIESLDTVVVSGSGGDMSEYKVGRKMSRVVAESAE